MPAKKLCDEIKKQKNNFQQKKKETYPHQRPNEMVEDLLCNSQFSAKASVVCYYREVSFHSDFFSLSLYNTYLK